MINKINVGILLYFIFASNSLFGFDLNLGIHSYQGDLSVSSYSGKEIHCSRFKNGSFCIPIIVTSSGQIVKKKGWKSKKEEKSEPVNAPIGAYLRKGEINSGPESISLNSESLFPLRLAGRYNFDPSVIYFATAIFRNEKTLFATQVISFKVVDSQLFIPLKENAVLTTLPVSIRKALEDELSLLAKEEKLSLPLKFGE